MTNATGADLEDRAAAEVDLRYRFAARLGYGVTGERNIQELTHAEMRTYLEGMRRADEREAEKWGDDGRAEGQPRESDVEMMRDLEEDLAEGSAS